MAQPRNPARPMDPDSERKEWFLVDYNTLQPLGPFSRNEICEKIDRGQLRVDDFIWSSRLENPHWVRIFEVQLFNTEMKTYPKCQIPKRSQGLAKSANQTHFKTEPARLNFRQKGQFGVENLYRRYPRAPLETDAIIHNHKIFRKTRTIDISEKGVFIAIEDTELFEKGEDIIITIRNAPEIGTFSASAVIMRSVVNHGFKGYGLYFLRLNPRTRQKIAHWVLKRLSENISASLSSDRVDQANHTNNNNNHAA